MLIMLIMLGCSCVILCSVSDVGEFARAKASSGPSEAKAATLATMKS
jgi:hypothetical protein